MMKHKFWPLDYDPEGEIYDNPSWDLPGFRSSKQGPKVKPRARKNSAG